VAVQLIDVDVVARMIRAQVGDKLPSEEPIEATTEFDDLGVSSLDVSEVFFAIEDEVGIELDPVPASDATTVGGLVEVVNAQVCAAAPQLAEAT
jgi:acyl carrier protein